MGSNSFVNARRVFAAVIASAVVLAAGLGTVSAQSAVTIPGVSASQPNAPVKLVSCAAVVTGTSFFPQLVFDAPSNLKSSTVTYSFFNKSNVALGQTDVTPPYTKKTYPLGTDTFTCAISHEDLADGGVFPTVAHNNSGIVIAGIVGVGIIAALASHGGSSSTPSQTAPPTTAVPVTPSPTPTPTLAPGVTPSPTPSPTATATASPTLAPGVTPSPTPSPTVKPTATPTAKASPVPTPTATATATASPTPTPTPSPVGALTLNPNSFSFTSTGATGMATIMESGGYTGTFSIKSNTCSSGGAAPDSGAIATFGPTPPLSNPTNITVTSGEAGSCTITYQDATGNIAQITVHVTLSNVVVNGKHRVPATLAPTVKPLPVKGATPSHKV